MMIMTLCSIGFTVSLCLTIFLLLTKKWHGFLSFDNTDGVQKFHSLPVPRIGGVPIIIAFGLISILYKEEDNLLFIIFLSSLPMVFFGILEDLKKNTSVNIRLF